MRITGIDLGINKIALSTWDDEILINTYAWESKMPTRPAALMDLGCVVLDYCQEWSPDHVWIEDTLIGNNRKYSIKLSQTMGAVLAELGGYQMQQECGVYLVNVSTWKKEVLGNGKADKTAIRDYMYSRDSAYPELCGQDQDRFDAACIGYYGVRIAQRSQLEISG